MPRILIAIAAGCVALASVYVALASFSPQSSNLGAGSAAVLPCDTDGVGIVYDVQYDYAAQAWLIYSLTVSGVSEICFGGALELVAVDASGNAIGSGSIAAVNASSFTVNLAPDPIALNVAGVRIVIVGP